MKLLKKLLKKDIHPKENEENIKYLEEQEIIFDALPSPADYRDYPVSDYLVASISLPEEYSLIKYLPAIRHQGGQGSCVPQAVACVKEYHEMKDVNFKSHFSPQFLYNLRPNHPQMGMYTRDALNLVKKYGICPEKYFPYDTSTKPESITQELLEKAENYKIEAYARVNTIEELKNAIYQNGPCIIVFPAYSQSSSTFWLKKEGDKFRGYHCVAVVGWTKDSFILRNSWGYFWGALGYGYYKYSDWGVHTECWSLIDEKSKIIPEDITKKCCGLF